MRNTNNVLFMRKVQNLLMLNVMLPQNFKECETKASIAFLCIISLLMQIVYPYVKMRYSFGEISIQQEKERVTFIYE
jgi:hypothetical protein